MQPPCDEIRKVWDERAQAHKEDSRASMPDRFLIDLEIRRLSRHILHGDAVLDIGCANGYTDLKIASRRKARITGFDNSEAMISEARKALAAAPLSQEAKGRIVFETGDLLDPEIVKKYQPQNFDKVVTKRVLINIPTWEGQQQAIENIYHILAQGKVYIMMESTLQGYENISRMRERFGIERTQVRWHNKYLDENTLIPFLKRMFDIEQAVNFSSTYYVGSRVIQPLLLKPFGKEPSYDFVLNRLFAWLPSLGDRGIQKMFVLRKKRM